MLKRLLSSQVVLHHRDVHPPGLGGMFNEKIKVFTPYMHHRDDGVSMRAAIQKTASTLGCAWLCFTISTRLPPRR